MSDPGMSDVHVPSTKWRLRKLRLKRIDLVDKGASHDLRTGEGAHVLLYKRDAVAADDPTGGNGVDKRDVSTKEREALADKGQAMPDGGYPIANVADLKNAIQAIGRAKNPAAVKAHIRRRARALGATDQIPDSWGGGNTEKSWLGKMLGVVVAKLGITPEEISKQEPITFEGAQMAMSYGELLEDLRGDVDALCMVISSAVNSDTADKAKAINAAVDAYIADVKEDVAEWLGAGGDDDSDLMKRDEGGAAAEPTQEGVQHMADDKTVETPVAAAPAAVDDVQKRIDEAVAKAQAENVELRKRLEVMEDIRKRDEAIKKAAQFKSLPIKADDDYKVFQALDGLAPEISKRAYEILTAADEGMQQAGLFKSVGTSRESAGGALEQIKALVAERVAKGTGVTEAQAWEAVMRERPELYKQHRSETAAG